MVSENFFQMKLKYVIVDDCYPILFGEYYQHSVFKNRGTITSAGFCSIKEVETPSDRMDITTVTMTEVSVWGESISLGVKSDPEHDKRLLERMFNGS